MPELIINPESLRDAAATFGGATDTLMTLLKDLNEATEKLEKDWAGVSQQTFYKQYEDLQKYLDAFAAISANIAKEMNAMADRFEKLDKEAFEVD